MRFLFRWQHVHPGTQLSGLQGTLQVVGQLQGLEATCASWERDILKSRIHAYDRRGLDALSLAPAK